MTASGDVLKVNVGAVSAATRTVAINAYNQLIFVTLMATAAVHGEWFRIIKRTLSGLGVIQLLFIGHVILLVAAIDRSMPAATMDVLDVAFRIFSLAVCIGLSVLYLKSMHKSKIHRPVDREGGRINENIAVVH